MSPYSQRLKHHLKSVIDRGRICPCWDISKASSYTSCVKQVILWQRNLEDLGLDTKSLLQLLNGLAIDFNRQLGCAVNEGKLSTQFIGGHILRALPTHVRCVNGHSIEDWEKKRLACRYRTLVAHRGTRRVKHPDQKPYCSVLSDDAFFPSFIKEGVFGHWDRECKLPPFSAPFLILLSERPGVQREDERVLILRKRQRRRHDKPQAAALLPPSTGEAVLRLLESSQHGCEQQACALQIAEEEFFNSPPPNY